MPRRSLTRAPEASTPDPVAWRAWPDVQEQRNYEFSTEETAGLLGRLCGSSAPPNTNLIVGIRGAQRSVASFERSVTWPVATPSADLAARVRSSPRSLRLGDLATRDLMDVLVPGPVPAGIEVTATIVSDADEKVLAALLGPLDALRDDKDLLEGEGSTRSPDRASVTRTASSLLEHGGIVMLLAVGAQGFGNLLFHAIAARVVGPAGYGALGALLATMLALAVPITSVQVVVTRSVAELGHRGDARILMRRSIQASMVIALATMLASPAISSFLHLHDVAQAALIGPYVAIALVGAVARGIQAGRRRFGTVAASYGAGAAARVALGLLLIPLLGVTGALAATIASELTSTLVASRGARTRPDLPLSIRLSSGEIFGTVTAMAGLWVFAAGDAVMARHSLSAHGAGFYIAASNASRVALLAPQAIITVALPRFVVDRHRRSDRSTVLATMGLVTVVTAIGAVIIDLAGSLVLSVLYGPHFASALLPLPWLLASSVTIAVVTVCMYHDLARRSRVAQVVWVGALLEMLLIARYHSTATQVATVVLVASVVQLLISVTLTLWALRPDDRTPSILLEGIGDLLDSSVSMPTSRATSSADPTPLSILILNWRDPLDVRAGGAEVYHDEVARAWVAKGHRVTWFCPRVEGRPDDEVRHGIHFMRRGSRWSVYRLARRHLRTLDDGEFDVILEVINTRPFEAARSAPDIPTVAFVHQVANEVWLHQSPLPIALTGKYLLEPVWLRRCRTMPTLVVSESTRRSLVDRGYTKVEIVPTGVHRSAAPPLLDQKVGPRLVFCGRLVGAKRPHDAIEAFRRFSLVQPDAELVVIGSGKQEDRLRRHAPPGVRFTWRIDDTEKLAEMAAADALVATSVREGWGLVVSEAASVGTPAVAYDVPGLRDSVAAAGGVLCAPTPASLAEALASVLPSWEQHPPALDPDGGARPWSQVAHHVLGAMTELAGLRTTAPSSDVPSATDDPQPVEEDRTPVVSVIVPTRDAASNLESCLVSIRDQIGVRVELIVVDNASSDNTKEIAGRFADVVIDAGPERSAQRNIGASLATAPVVVFIDADMVLDPGVLCEASSLITEHGADLVILSELAKASGAFGPARELEKTLYLGDESSEAARCFRREVFDAVGGFDESMTGFEDWDLHDRLTAGGAHVLRTEAITWHVETEISLREQFSKKRYYGQTSQSYLNVGQRRRSALARTSLLANPRLLSKRPTATLALGVLKTVELTGLLVGSLEGSRNVLSAQSPPKASRNQTRVVHLIAGYSPHEAMGRSVTMAATDQSIEHHLLAAHVDDADHAFASVHDIGGLRSCFLVTRRRRVRQALAEIDPDVVHLHGGPLSILLARFRFFDPIPRVVSIYHWPSVPRLRDVRRVGVRKMLHSQILAPRIFITRLLQSRIAATATNPSIVRIVTHDPRATQLLTSSRPKVEELRGGTTLDGTTARWEPDRPIIAFAGRAESVRGIKELIDAVAMLAPTWPELRLRLLLIKRPELPRILEHLDASGILDRTDVVVEPSSDLRSALASCTLLALPFQLDGVTLLPAYTVLESMSVGLPVIGTRVDSISSVVDDGRSGVLVEAGDTAALAAAIAGVLRDEPRWRSIAEHSLHTAKRYGWPDFIAAMSGVHHGASAANQEQVRMHFDEVGASYERHSFASAGLQALSLLELDHTTSLLGPVEGARILDAGSGTGRLASILSERGAKVVALDASPAMIDALRERSLRDVVCADLAAPLPFAPATFDAVVALRVLKWVPHWRSTLEELVAAVRPGGTLVVEVTNRRSLAALGYRGSQVRLVTMTELTNAARQLGLRLETVKSGVRLPHPLYARVRSPRGARRVLGLEAQMQRAAGWHGARSIIVRLVKEH